MATKQETKSQVTGHKVSCAKFNLSKFHVAPYKQKTSSDSQHKLFPQYEYADGTVTTPVIISGSIKLKGGIPQTDPSSQYNKTDNDCFYFLLYKDEDDPRNVELFNVMEQIDAFYIDEINEKKNTNGVICQYVAKNESTPFDKELVYGTTDENAFLVKHTDKDEKDKSGKIINTKKISKMKIKIATKYEAKLTKDMPREVRTEVYLKDPATGGPKSEAEPVKTLDDLRRILVFGTTVKFALAFTKFWITKKGKNKEGCGFGLTCNMVYIEEQSKRNANVLSSKVFSDDDDNIKPIEQKSKTFEDDDEKKKEKEEKHLDKKKKGKKNDESEESEDTDEKDGEDEEDDESEKTDEEDEEDKEEEKKPKKVQPKKKGKN